VDPVKAAPLYPSAYLAQCREAAALAGFRVETYGEILGCPLVALTRRTPGPRPRIYVSSGMHGDEPAAPLALLDMLTAGVFDDRATWLLCPMLNPTGHARGTRENHDGRDLNRDYKDRVSIEAQSHARWLSRQPPFALTICLHEDWEAKGFYLYELNPTHRPSLAEAMIAAVEPICPIERSAIIDGREAAAPGIIRPVSDPLLRDNWPEAIYLRHHHTTLSYTLESPSAFPLKQRIQALRAATETALARIK
jgi:protein MpaA